MIKIFFALSLVIVVGSCKGTIQEIVFKNERTIELGESINTCNFVERVNGVQVKEEMIKNNYIEINGDVLTCEDIDTSNVGLKKARYHLGNQIEVLNLEVKDTKGPEIVAKENILEIKEGDKVTLENLVNVKDLSEIKNISYNPESLDSAGTHYVLVKATDVNDNVSEKVIEVKVNVKKEDVPNNASPYQPQTQIEPHREPITQNESNNTQNQNSACKAGVYSANGEDAVTILKDYQKRYGCVKAIIHSDGTQYGWTIICECQN